MKFRIPFQTLRGQLMLWFTLLSAVPMLILGLVLYRQLAQTIREEANIKLAGMRDSKVERVTSWMSEFTGDVQSIIEYNHETLLPPGKNVLQSDPETLSHLRTDFNSHIRYHRAFTDLMVVDPKTAMILVSASGKYEGKSVATSLSFTEPLRTKSSYLGQVHVSDLTQGRRLNVAVPLLMPGPEATVVAVFIADIDMTLLDKIIQERAGLGDSGETVVVNKDSIVINELRWRQDAPMQFKNTAMPAVMASSGKTGVAEYLDYRGKPVVAAYTFIPSLGWGMVVKQEQAELYEPVTELARNLVLVLLFGIAVAVLLAVPVTSAIARPLQAMRKTAESFGSGNLSARNRFERKDEIGQMAQAFDVMADQVQMARAAQEASMVESRQRLLVQQGHSEIMEAMTHSGTSETFCGELLQVMMRVTRSDFGAFYLRGADGRFVPVASQGVSASALEPFTPESMEGSLNTAFATRKLVHLKEIPSDTRFTFRTVAGTAVPRALLTIPVVVGGEVVALLAMGGLSDYAASALGILDTSMTAFGVGFANLLASAEAYRLGQEMRSKNAELEVKTSELSAQAEELRKQSEVLQSQNTELEVQSIRVSEANRLKSAFLSNMSHELRTPLNSVLALSRVLQIQSKDKLTEEETSYLSIIERNGKHLLSLINDILDLAKIEAGRVELAIDEVNLEEKINTISESLEPICNEKGLALKVSVEPDLPPLRTDARRVHQIIQNVMGNAVKFTLVGTVSVNARRRGDHVEVTISDTGIGIPERDLPHIFDEFRQVDGGTARSFEGSGLGLAIASKSANLLGGRIEVKSILGSGSSFTITLPLNLSGHSSGSAHGEPSQPSTLQTELGFPARQASTQATVETRASSQPRRTVLVVDDNPDDAALIANYLTSEGYDTLTANSGLEALRQAEIHRPFAITLDVIMPDLDGWEVLQRLKQNPVTAHISVIIVSLADDRDTGMALGAVGVVAKPVDRTALITEVRRVTPRGMVSVLVVDDVELERKMMSDMLQSDGIHVRQAADGKTCLAAIDEEMPDAVVLDLMMPGVSGFDVLDRLRSNSRTVHLPVIIVTARELSPEDRAYLRGRVATVVEKSRLSAGDLLKEITHLLERLGKVAPITTSPASPQAKRILLVEDSEPAIMQIRMVLETAGYRVDVARGGQQALDLMGDPPPDGIILDLMMPHIDGFAVLERMRGTPATAQTPVLILTAKDLTAEDLKRLSANNVQQLIQKGDVDRHELLRQVDRLMTHKHRTQVAARGLPGDSAQHKPAPTPRRRPAHGQLANILAIEDNPDNQATLRAVLKARCVLREASDGENGLHAAITEQPDLILLDLSLPKMDGWAVLRRLRATPSTRDIPVVVLTAHAMPGDREKSLDAGADDYLSKPIEVDKLLATLGRWLEPPDIKAS